MPTLYVRNVPSDRYEALRKAAKRNGHSIREEVIVILREAISNQREFEKRYGAKFKTLKPSPSGSCR
jgi:plasmid stability protein